MDMLYSMLHHSDDFDIWEATIRDMDGLTDDEDARVGWGDWERSLAKFGTCAYLGDIPPEDLRFFANVNKHL